MPKRGTFDAGDVRSVMARPTRETLLAEYAALSPIGSPDRGVGAKAFCRRWSARVAGLYRHSKGGLYAVQGMAIVEADLTPMVVYLASDGSSWLRSVENFFGEARPGVRRFRRVAPKAS